MEPGATVERQIAEGETHSYLITLAPGQFLRVTVNQKDVDVFVRLLDEKGGQLVESRNYLDTGRPERLSFAANEYGDYRLEVIAPGEKESIGSYELKVEPLRVATPEDLSLIAAEKLTAEGEVLQAQGKAEPLKEAISRYEQSLSLWRQAGDGQGEADTLQNLAIARRTVGESDKAIEHLALALSIYRAAGERRGESQTLRGLGLFHHLSGDLHSALEYYEQTLPLSRELKDREGEASTLNNIGGVYYYMGEYQKGLEYYGSSLVLQQSLANTKGEATTLNNIGEIYRTLGEHRRALEYLDKALLLRRSIKDLRGDGVTLNNIGLTHGSLGEYEKSLDHHERSLSLRRTVGDRLGEAASETLRPADESGATRFRRLRFSRQEADAIAALVPAEMKLKAMDFAASRATATSAALGQYRILHFATHGLLDSRQPELSCIVLSLVDERGRAQNGFLSLHEIAVQQIINQVFQAVSNIVIQYANQVNQWKNQALAAAQKTAEDFTGCPSNAGPGPTNRRNRSAGRGQCEKMGIR